jgi:hypothetical protein
MIRETLDAGSSHVSAFVTSGNGVAFQRRLVFGDLSDHTAGPNVTAPYWVRVTRFGDAFTAYASVDGSSWTFLGSVAVSLASKVLAGLALTSHNNAALNVSVLDNVNGSFGTNAPPLIALVEPTHNTTVIQPRSITLIATASDSDGTISQVDFFNGPGLLGSVGGGVNGQYSLTWSNVTPGTYSLQARAIDDWGGTNYSDQVSLVVLPLTLTVNSGALVSGQFSLVFPAQDNEHYVVETSTDLRQWVPVLTNAPDHGLFQFTAPVAANAQRFYRVRY